MNKTKRAVMWLEQHQGWQEDQQTYRYVDNVLHGKSANNFVDRSLIIAAGSAVGYWGK